MWRCSLGASLSFFVSIQQMPLLAAGDTVESGHSCTLFARIQINAYLLLFSFSLLYMISAGKLNQKRYRFLRSPGSKICNPPHILWEMMPRRVACSLGNRDFHVHEGRAQECSGATGTKLQAGKGFGLFVGELGMEIYPNIPVLRLTFVKWICIARDVQRFTANGWCELRLKCWVMSLLLMVWKVYGSCQGSEVTHTTFDGWRTGFFLF